MTLNERQIIDKAASHVLFSVQCNLQSLRKLICAYNSSFAQLEETGIQLNLVCFKEAVLDDDIILCVYYLMEKNTINVEYSIFINNAYSCLSIIVWRFRI